MAIHDIQDYKTAKKFIDEYSDLIKDLDKMHQLCYNWMEYADMRKLHTDINEIKIMLEIQKKYYIKIVNSKGIQ